MHRIDPSSRWLAAFAGLLLSPHLPAQDPGPSEGPDELPAGHSMHGQEFNEGPRQAAYLMGGTGDVHLQIAAADPAAQAFFDQGVGQLHGFWYFEAERSFRQVAAFDPDCAMAYWGMAMANVNNARRAAVLAAQAALRRHQADARGRLYIDALAAYYQVGEQDLVRLGSEDPEARRAARTDLQDRIDQRDEKSLARDLVRGFEKIIAAFPDDIEARAFLANQMWLNTRAGIEYASHAAADALLERVFADNPMHPAHHYRIHLWDYEAPERALASAAVSGQAAPAIAHQWHMAGHIYARLHRHADAAWQQEASARVDHARMMRDRVMPHRIFNYGHNNEWLVRSLRHIGAVREAVDLATNMIELPRHPVHNRLTKRGSIAAYGRQRLFEVLETYQMWPELAAACQGSWLEPTSEPRQQARRLRALGLARFRLGDRQAGEACLQGLEDLVAARRAARHEAVDAAEEEARRQDKSAAEIDAAMAKVLKAETRALRVLQGMQDELAAWALWAAGETEVAAAAFADLQGVPDRQRAEMALLVGDLDEALDRARRAAEKNPKRVPELATLVWALHRHGDRQACEQRFAELRALAGRADLDAPLLARLAPVAAAFGAPPDWRLPQPPAADLGQRPALDDLGPFRWSPVPVPDFELPKAGGGTLALSDFRGQPVLVIHYLGFGCLHCVEQLEAFRPRTADFVRAGIRILAVGTDPLSAVEESLATFAPGERFEFPLLADPELATFRAYRAFDDFEGQPLHGTFLIDGRGLLRWQDIGYEPFDDVDFLLAEARRLLALPVAGRDSR